MDEEQKTAFWKKIDWKAVGIYVLWAFVVTLIMETLSRFHANGVLTGGIFGGFKTIFAQPFVFFYGVILMLLLLSPALLFKRRYFVMGILSVWWIGLAVADFVLLSYRVTPFAFVEFTLIDAALGVFTKYFSKLTLTILVLVVIAAIAALVMCWRKVPKIAQLNRLHSLLVIVGLALLVTVSTVLGFSVGKLSNTFPNLANAYLDYGFAYTFLNGIDMGIHKPKDYSEEKVAEIIGSSAPNITAKASDAPPTEEEDATEEPVASAEPNVTGPNIIFLQLESFFDITEVEDLQLSADPVPYFRQLLAQYSSGYLSVPVIGAGTANTEFEVMTGIDLDFFGPGEYPYKTILKTQTCESAAFNLREEGYAAHAIHNNRANFYSRDEIFSQLGYNDFTSIEMMDVSEFTPNGWAKDKCLTEEILKSLRSTNCRDYVYCISVQGHGKYPTEPYEGELPIKVLSGVEDEGRKCAIEYYVNEIKEMDTFLQELVTALGQLNEPTVLIAYGDHLPGLGFTAEELSTKDMNLTQYFVWNNCGWEKEDEDVQAYQLSSRILERANVNNGIINAYHQTHKDDEEEEYLENLKILSYDMLYGENDATGGVSKYIASNLKFGVTEVVAASVEQDKTDPDYIIVKGDNFTQYSRVTTGRLEWDSDEEQEEFAALDEDVDAKAYLQGYANRYDRVLETEFIDEHTLRAKLPEYEDGDKLPILVMQKYKSKLTLKVSNLLEITLKSTEDDGYGEDFQNNNENYQNSDVD